MQEVLIKKGLVKEHELTLALRDIERPKSLYEDEGD